MDNNIDPIEHFSKSYYGNELLKEHSLDTHGTWMIHGGDMSDYGAHSSNAPMLGIVSGKLRHVVDYAYTLDRWYGYGGGGSITKINVLVLTTESVERRKRDQIRLKEVQAEMEALEKRLKILKG